LWLGALLLLACSDPPPPVTPPPAQQPPPHTVPELLAQADRALADCAADSSLAECPEVFAALDAAQQQAPSDPISLARMGVVALTAYEVQVDRKLRRGEPPAHIRDWLTAALRQDPGHEQARRYLARYYSWTREYEAALEQLRAVLADHPDDRTVQVEIGRCLVMLGRYSQASQMLEQVRSSAPGDRTDMDSLKASELLGRIYSEQGQVEGAEQLLLDAIDEMGIEEGQAMPTDLVACPYMALGMLYRKVGRDGEAAQMLMRTADLEPMSPRLQYLAARQALLAGQRDHALEYIDRALAIHDDPDYRRLRQLALEGQAGGSAPALDQAGAYAALDAALRAFELHDFQRAQDLARVAVDLEPTGRARVLLGFLALLDARYDDARADFSAVAAASPGDPGAQVGMGHLALVRKDNEGARVLFAPTIAAGEARVHEVTLPDDHTDSYEWLIFEMACLGQAWSHANQALFAQAVSDFDRVLSFQPADIFSLIGKGNSLNALGHLDEAEALFRRVLVQDPHNPYATAELALVHFNRGDMEQAEAAFRSAMQSGPATYTCPYEGLGLVYLKRGDMEQAKGHFERAISNNPEIEYKKFNGLARIYMADGRLDEAERLLRKSIENYPYDDEAPTLLDEIRRTRSAGGAARSAP